MYIYQWNRIGVQCAVKPTAVEGGHDIMCGKICSARTGTRKQMSIFSWLTLLRWWILYRAIQPSIKKGGGKKRRKKIKRKGRKEIPDVNSKVCPAPVCGHWSFVYLLLLKPLPPAAALGKLHNKAREFSEALQSSSPTSGRHRCCSLSEEHTVNLTGWGRRWRCAPWSCGIV